MPVSGPKSRALRQARPAATHLSDVEKGKRKYSRAINAASGGAGNTKGPNYGESIAYAPSMKHSKRSRTQY